MAVMICYVSKTKSLFTNMITISIHTNGW